MPEPPEHAEQPAARPRRSALGMWVSVMAWVLLFAGLSGVVVDSVYGLSPAALCISYVLAVVGPVLFALGAVLRAPRPPPFVSEMPDPFES